MIKWRKWNNIIHRDLGYLVFGLSVVYALSGFILNHKHNWNPNYVVKSREISFNTGVHRDISVKSNLDGLLAEMNLPIEYHSTFQPAPGKLNVYYSDKNVYIDLTSGKANVEIIKNRSGFREMNYLHLNLPRKLWTYMADFYAFALLILAVTGLFVLKGKKGIKGRGLWLTAIGILIPLLFLLIYPS